MSAQACSGAEAAQLVQDTLADGFSLAGRRGFYFLYELLTGQATLALTLSLTLTLALALTLPLSLNLTLTLTLRCCRSWSTSLWCRPG